MIKGFIAVKNNVEALHYYKDAPSGVSYLSNCHRHLLYIETRIEVFGDDRELEFILVKHAIEDYLHSQVEWDGYAYNMYSSSCEMLARELLAALQTMYGTHRDMQVSVYEDNENGAIITYTKEEK